MVVLRPFFKKEKRSFSPSTFQPPPPLRRAKKIDVQGTSVEQKVDISLKSCYNYYVKRSCANNSPTAPFKTAADQLVKNNRNPAKVDGYFFALFFRFFLLLRLEERVFIIVSASFTHASIKPMKANKTGAIANKMPIISTSCKRLLLSSDFDSTFIMHHLTFKKSATVTNFTVLILYHNSR